MDADGEAEMDLEQHPAEADEHAHGADVNDAMTPGDGR